MLERLLPLLKLVAAALLTLVVADALVFRSGAYAKVVKLYSTAGSVVGGKLAIRRYRDPARKNVLVLGNSQIGEGFDTHIADAHAGRADLHFVNGSVPGTTPRVWDYLLREVDPDATRFAAVVLMADYDLGHAFTDFDNFGLDISYATPLVGLRDLNTFPDSFGDAALRARARRAILLPTQAYAEDIQDLLLHPLARWHDVRKTRRGWLAAIDVYGGHAEALPDLDLDAQATPRDWGSDAATVKPKLEGYLRDLRKTAPAALQDANAAYQRDWIGRIAARYAGQHVPVIVFSMARGPWKAQFIGTPQPNAALVALRDAGRIELVDGGAFTDLERPAYFVDTLHLNHAGREAFSAAFASEISARVP